MKKIILGSLFATVTGVGALVSQTTTPVQSQSISIPCSSFRETIPLRDMPAQTDADRAAAAISHEKAEELAEAKRPGQVKIKKQANKVDPIVQKTQGTQSLKSPIINFNGLTDKNSCPPDPNGAVGPTQYVEAINSSYRVFSRTGTPLTAIIDLKSLFPGSNDDGDPIVLYDKFADRWFVSEFSVAVAPIGLLVAVSKTGDATGAYYTYTFTNPEWTTSMYPDYPKYSIWTDGYYMTGQFNPEGIAVLDRTRMIAGKSSAAMILSATPPLPAYFGGPNSGLYSSAKTFDCDGATLPAYGTPNYMVFFENTNEGSASNMIKFYQLTHDTAAKTLTIAKWDSIVPTTFNSYFTGGTEKDISQPGAASSLDALDGTFNFRVPYVSFSGYNSIVLSNTVNTGSLVAGIRWYEMRQDPATHHFSIYQQATYAPADGASRWNGSIAMDTNGNIALEYSKSSSTIYPSICYTGRKATDPLNTMTGTETTVVAGTAPAVSCSNRWGDYSQLNIDPTDFTTFWGCNEYDSAGNAGSQIFSFKIASASCNLTVTTTSPNLICNEGTAVATATGTGPFSYSWSPSGGTKDTASNLAAGTYKCVVTNTVGCKDSATQVVTVTSPPVLNITGNNPLCAGNTETLTASGATTYTWAPATGLNITTGSAVSANPTANTTYTITGKNSVCTSIDSVAVMVNAIPTLSVTASPAIICAGGSSTLSVSGAVTYNWNNGSTAQSLNVSPAVTTTYTITGANAAGCTATQTVTVTVDAPITITMNAVNASCNGLTNGNATATVIGGTKPYAYAWSNGATTNLIYNLSFGKYDVTVTDGAGCVNYDSATIATPTALSVTASSTNASCGTANGTATATPTGGVIPYNYTWSAIPAQTGAIATGLAAGTYTVTVTDGSGCTANTSVTLTASSGPVITPTINNSTCALHDGKIKTSISGGTAPYRYSWNNGDTLSTDSNLAASTYILTVTDANGCSTFQAMNVNDAGAPVINASGGSNVNCNGDTTGSIAINVTGGTGGYKYLWSNSATTANITGLSAGPYQVTVTDANGCVALSTINITEPAALVISTNIIQASCGNADGSAAITVTGGASPYTYLWSTSATSTGIAGVAAGTYSVTVTDNNGCSTTSLASVGNASGPLVTLDSVIDMNCAAKTPGQIIITASGGIPPYTYLWSNSATTQNINNLGAGNYAVTVTDAAGCQGTNSATITTALPPGVSICMVSVDPKTGFNDLVWDASGNERIAEYFVYKETTTPGVFNKIGHSPGTSGTYTDTLSNSGQRSWGYELSELDSCGQASPISQSALFKTIHLTTTLAASNAVDLVWDNFEGSSFSYYIIYRDSVAGITKDSIASVNSSTFSYVDYPPITKNWYYHVGIGGALSCTLALIKGHEADAVNYNASKSNTGNITFVGPTSIVALSAVNTLNIYPNPTAGIFNLSMNLDKQQNVSVKIYNTLGQVIEQDDYAKQSGQLLKQYDFSVYSKGVYTVQVITGDGVTYRKVVIQ